ncbi:SDR family NAD(P)-dependent oxidoreductase [Aliikangiella maris]|uniref:SDR family oxidoreductase n=2 Tax=Aliikangiella maris TaxID=3162458 RepID=A0ABV3MMK4_9GAMM
MKAVLVTGSNGGIGRAICDELALQGYLVIGCDKSSTKNNLKNFICYDLQKLIDSEIDREKFVALLEEKLSSNQLSALINNAGIQILSSLSELSIEDFQKTLDINLTVPLVLSKLLFDKLKYSSGSIINIGSIHSKLTKSRFISYATSKAGLNGLTQSLAVDIGKYVRVNSILPAAIKTDMLISGFDTEQQLNQLSLYHPSNKIGTPEEVAKAVLFLISDSCPFLNGATLEINGGIGARLYDPS